MHKRLDLTNLGGMPGTQQRLAFMQQSYREGIGALARLCGDKVIVAGCTVTGDQMGAGWVVIGGELMPFMPGTIGTGIVVNEVAGQPLVFRDGVAHVVEYTRQASFGSPALFPYADLKRLSTILVLQEQLAELMDHTHSYDDLDDLPAAKVIYKGSHTIGNAPSTDGVFTITIPDMGVAPYTVIGTMRGQSSNHDLDNDVSWVVTHLEQFSFQVSVREYAPATQNLVFDFIILR